MSSEIIQSVAYDNYDALQHVNFIFSQNFISLFWGLFNDEIHLRVRYMSWIVLEIKVPCIQWEGWACTHEGFNFFFASCSHKVIIKFPKDSPSCQVVPQSVPNITSVWSLMVCPKFNSHVYKLKRWGSLKGGDHREKNTFVSILQLGVHGGASIGSDQSSKIGDGPINMTPSQK